jgi:hypothetical protein
MSLWLVTTGEPSTQGPGNRGDAMFVEAESGEDAAAEMMWRVWEDRIEGERDGIGGVEPPHNVFVVPIEDPSKLQRHRATVAAERVPDAFQCCGGMPNMLSVGTYDEHSAICPNRPKDEEEQEREPDAGWPPQ